MEDRKSFWEILVPAYSNNGKKYSVNYHHSWDRDVRKYTGGMTILRSAKGHWTNSKGKTFIERMIPVRIYCTKSQIEKIIDLTLEHYNQEAVMAYEISQNVIIKNRT